MYTPEVVYADNYERATERCSDSCSSSSTVIACAILEFYGHHCIAVAAAAVAV
jgi:hypothetical protein